MAALCWAMRCSCWHGATVAENEGEEEGHDMPLHQLTDNLPTCSPETLEHLTWAIKDTVSLECLTWAVYDNILVPGLTP